MAGPKLTLPPFAALRAFHAAATHERYRDAAESLGLTESAISHQVRRLEEFLRTSLIDRSGKRPKLTETGRRYLEQIEPAMRQIHAATEALLPASGRSTVRLTLPPSLAATWLIPKLGAFEREFPQIDLQLITTTRVVDLAREQVDVAIRHGKGAWADVDSTLLLEETAMPVCAPGYLDPSPKEPSPEVLRDVRIIVNANIPDEWEEWARAHGVEPPARDDMIELDAAEQALQVAESGHGIAMGRRPVVDSWLERGRLVAPFGDADPTGAAYYLCRPAGAAPTAAGRRLERWLNETATEWRAENAQAVATS
ncbi:MAG: LysR substrate-binding domain-containing protein [Alphaproteobacteria bacterium]|nr:LysR substrate-binding domain-containing protein [Alphaproteobacteria bacterium]